MKNGKKLNRRRKFSEDFKKMIVGEYEGGKFTIKELSKLHSVCFQSIYQWVYKYSTYNEAQTQVVEMKQSSLHKLKAYEDRIKELERVVGQKQIKIDYLEHLIEIAGKEFNTDIKKNSVIQQSNALGIKKSNSTIL